MKELEQINTSSKDNDNEIYETLNIKTNELAIIFQDLKCQKENSGLEKKDFFLKNLHY